MSAQIDSTKTDKDNINFDEFVSADGESTRLFCSQKIAYLSPYRFISLGYENIFSTAISTVSNPETTNSNTTTNSINQLGGLRFAVNTPVISKNSITVSLGANIWNSNVALEKVPTDEFIRNITQLNSMGLNATVFKPFNEKNFAIFQVSGDINGNYTNVSDITGKGFTFSATAIYGWKKSDNFMWGLGVSRTYRAGALIHIPVVLYNRTFNKTWGIETVFPAKLNIRRNFSPTSLLMLGYEIEGNSYNIATSGASDLYLRRGELKPRLSYEQKISGFIWLAAQAGVRFDWRYDVYDIKNPSANEKLLFANTLGNPFYFNLSLNFVSP
jgi:hypothetical protein